MIEYSYKIVVPPPRKPVTLEEAKTHLRITDDSHDARVNLWIASASDYVEAFLGRALIEQTVELALESFPAVGGVIELPLPPLIEVVSIVYDDTAGNEQTLDAGLYDVNTHSEPARIKLVGASSAWPSTLGGLDAVRVLFRAGYLDSTMSPAVDNVPELIRGAVLLRIEADFDDDAVNATKLRDAADALLRRRRFDLSMA